MKTVLVLIAFVLGSMQVGQAQQAKKFGIIGILDFRFAHFILGSTRGISTMAAACIAAGRW
jgi:hypothetical protein